MTGEGTIMSYLLTVSRTDFSERKRRWADPSHKPLVRRFGTPELPLAYPGALVHVGDSGEILNTVPLWGPKGMLILGERLLVASFSEVKALSLDLKTSWTLLSAGWCNDLHSLRASRRGAVLAVSGLDSAVEFSDDGSLLWQWWADEHGYSTTLEGSPWAFHKEADHRGHSYPVELQSTHINAIAALDDDTFLATLLHKNCLIKIDRNTGFCAVVLEDLGRPHAVRVAQNGLITVADTTNGAAVVLQMQNGIASLLDRVTFNTTWIHDAFFDGARWLIVDGEYSRVIHADARGKVLRVDEFPSEWCLYEVLPFDSRLSDAIDVPTSRGSSPLAAERT
jgi:hypothetical protein